MKTRESSSNKKDYDERRGKREHVRKQRTLEDRISNIKEETKKVKQKKEELKWNHEKAVIIKRIHGH